MDVIRFLLGFIGIVIVILVAIAYVTGCSTVEPIARTACEVVDDICSYREVLCDTTAWFRTNLTREEMLDSLNRLGEELQRAREWR